MDEMPNTMAIWLKILTVSLVLNTSITIARPITMPETAVAWSILNRKKSSLDVDKIQPNDATINMHKEIKRIGRLPYLSDKGPSKICNDAEATIYKETESCIIEKLV